VAWRMTFPGRRLYPGRQLVLAPHQLQPPRLLEGPDAAFERLIPVAGPQGVFPVVGPKQ